MGIGVTSLLDVQAAAAREVVMHGGRRAQHLLDGSAAAPEWVLDVEGVARTRVRAGMGAGVWQACTPPLGQQRSCPWVGAGRGGGGARARVCVGVWQACTATLRQQRSSP